MQFSRNLFATMIVAVFGALVLVGATDVGASSLGAAAQYSVAGFVRVFLAAAISFAVALIAVFLMEEKPLQTSHA
jgi:hypothetical protein